MFTDNDCLIPKINSDGDYMFLSIDTWVDNACKKRCEYTYMIIMRNVANCIEKDIEDLAKRNYAQIHIVSGLFTAALYRSANILNVSKINPNNVCLTLRTFCTYDDFLIIENVLKNKFSISYVYKKVFLCTINISQNKDIKISY